MWCPMTGSEEDRLLWFFIIAPAEPLSDLRLPAVQPNKRTASSTARQRTSTVHGDTAPKVDERHTGVALADLGIR